MADHASLTGASLHESKGAATAAINTVAVANGAGAAAFQALTYEQMSVGSVIQVGYATTTANTTTTTAIPADNTVPQITEGAQALSTSFTPKSATSTLLIESGCSFDASTTVTACLALFKNTDASALRSISSQNLNGGALLLFYPMTSGTTSAITFSIRFGANTGTCYLNTDDPRTSGSYGGTVATWIKITEIKA
jgi:hypothetical protein